MKVGSRERGQFWASRIHLERIELLILGAVALVAGLALAFGHIAEEVLEGDSTSFDRTILLAMRNPAEPADPWGPAWLEEAARDFTALGSYSILGLLISGAVVHLLLIRKGGTALWLVASVLGGAGLSTLLKIGFDRPRPDIVAHAARVFTMSFPSGHAALSAVTYLTLGALLASTTSSRAHKVYFVTLALLLTIVVGITRIYLGVHYPTDVLAGWCFGAAWAILCSLAWFWLEGRTARRKIETSTR